MTDEEKVISAIASMIDMADKYSSLDSLAKELLDSLGNRPAEDKLLMMATALAGALKAIAVAKRNSDPTKEGEVK